MIDRRVVNVGRHVRRAAIDAVQDRVVHRQGLASAVEQELRVLAIRHGLDKIIILGFNLSVD